MADTAVTVNVPADRVAAFHKFFGSWLEDASLILVAPGAIASPPPWEYTTKQDRPVAEKVIAATAPSVHELIAVLCDSADTPVDAGAIAVRCGVANAGAVSQLVALLAKACWDNNRPIPIHWVATSDHVQYWIPRQAGPTWRAVLSHEAPRVKEDGTSPLNDANGMAAKATICGLAAIRHGGEVRLSGTVDAPSTGWTVRVENSNDGIAEDLDTITHARISAIKPAEGQDTCKQLPFDEKIHSQPTDTAVEVILIGVTASKNKTRMRVGIDQTD